MARIAILDRLAFGALRSLVSLWVRPRILPEDLQHRVADRGRSIYYVLETFGAADRVVVEQVCRQVGVPAPAGELDANATKPAAFIFLDRRAGFFGTRLDRRTQPAVRKLVQKAVSDPSFDADLVPVNLFWGRAPDKERSWMRLLLSEGWDPTGRVRRMMSVIVNGRSLLVQFANPITLRSVVDEGPGPARAVRRFGRVLRNALRNQRSAAIGPDLSHRRTIVAHVLRTRAVRQAIADEMKAKKLKRRDALLQAKKLTDEIAADYSAAFVSFLYRILTWLWNRLYEGVEFHNIDSLQSVIDGNEIVYVPCHRSHMDYLLLSYVIYSRGYAVPHIAAGINLNMPVVGRFLRKGGAFFMRRSFRGSTLYTMVFMKYLGLMMARGHSLEYFVEGGRSRTGRLLQPKTGMLAMTVRSYVRYPRRPVVFIPVYFGYERVVEGKTYINELLGKPKEKESVFTMLRTLPALRGHFGKVVVSLGEPIRLDQLLGKHQPQWREQRPEAQERAAWISRTVDELALQIMTNINSAACVMPINLIALALLPTPKQSMIEADLQRQLELYASLLRQAPYSPRVHVTSQDGASMVRYGERMGVLVRRSHALGDVLQMTEENSVLMTYFRNNVVHLFALPSLIACCFLNNRALRIEDIQRLAWRIYPYVRDELFLRWQEDEVPQVVLELLEDFANHGLLESVDGGAQWRRPPTGSAQAVQLSGLANITVPILERYYLAISILLKAGSSRISQDVLETQCQLMAQRMSLLYQLHSPEFFDKSLFKNFIDLLRSRNVLGVNPDGKLTFTEMLPAVADDAQLVLHEQIRNSVLQVTHL